jgi:peptidoglycan hydrolase-like protein with peptidoglycan-binding domain
MSYASRVGGSPTFGGFGYFGLSGTYPIISQDTETSSLQTELVRLGFLRRTQDEFGVDGRMGPNTLNSVRAAAQYVSWTDAPYTPSNAAQLRSGSVTIPEDLVSRIRAASPAPAGTPGRVGAPVEDLNEPVVPDGSVLIGPHLDPEPVATQGSGSGWVPAAAIGGVVLAAGALIGYSMYSKKKKPERNRRRRRRSVSRRR